MALLLLTALPTAFATVQLIQNGGFEDTSPSPWIFYGANVGVGNTVGFAASGSQYLALGDNLVGSGQAIQTVTFPTNMIAATLSFDYATVTTNATGADSVVVYIASPGDGAGLNPLINVGSFTSANPTGYVSTVNNVIPYAGGDALSSYAGQQVEVYFYMNCSDSATTFYLDNVSLTAATTADIPSDDDFANPIVIPTTGITNYGTTTYASLETGEPEIAGNEGGHSVWWTWTAPATLGIVNISAAGSSYNTLLGVYTGTSLTNLTLITNGVYTSAHQAEIKFVPVPGTQYQIALDGNNGQSGNADFTLTFTPDKTPPTVSFSSPAAGAVVTNSAILVTGQANDNIAVASVQYRLQNADGVSAWRAAATTNLWTNWSATVTNLIPGTNTVTLEAIDTSTNVSTFVSRTFDYDVGAVLTLNTNGRGTISGATNGQLVNIGFLYKITAKAAAGFAFTGWTGSATTNGATLSFTGTTNLFFTANFKDDQKPVLSITTPTSGSHWSNTVLQFAGKASDNIAVAGVWYQLNGGAWLNPATSNGWITWSTNVTLTQSNNNTVKAYAVDGAGNYSTTNSVTFAYVPSAILQLATTGSGVISPNYSNALLQLGKTFTLTATARSGYFFSNWVDHTGAVLTNGPALKFVMQSNLLYTANFVPNPFLATAGTYEGLFFNTSDVVPSGSGFFSAVVANTGTFTAKFQVGTSAHSVAGKFALDGAWSTNTIAGLTGTSASLNLDLTGRNIITGGLTNAAWDSELTANLAPYSTAHPAPQAGKYTLVIPGTNSSGLPGGAGFGSVTVTPAGAVTLTGTLGDGTKATPSATVSAQGTWPLYIPTDATGQGLVIGWLTFTNEPDRDIDGVVNWFKPALASSSLYSLGFTNQIEVAGSVYALPAGAPVLKLTNGYVLLQDGGLSQSISNQFVLGVNNKVTGGDKLTLTFTPATGLFQGSTTNASGKTVTFSGAVLQKQTNGFGQFLNAPQSGTVSLIPHS